MLATAGHVDHGKSTLVRALTGMEPDRWAEERRRGMTIDLGFAWTTLPSGAAVAFVDVPGHERFVPNMLAGVGPVPAVVFVVAADEGWMPQSAEHLAAVDALGVRHGLLVVTRADLADPGPALAAARAEIAASSLGDVPAVAVSPVTGRGLGELRAALDALVAVLPPGDTGGPVRLWVDRSFTIRGAGTVVTGTLGRGTLRVGDTLEVGGRTVRVRGLQTLGATVEEAGALARVAVNLRGVDRDSVGRGDALLTPDAFGAVSVVDVRLHGRAATGLPPELTVHIGSAAVQAHVRPLPPVAGPDGLLRLRLARPLPLHVGDRALLRDPGAARVSGPQRAGPIVGGVTVLDVAPSPLRRRGAAACRAAELSTLDGSPDVAGELRRRGLVDVAELRRWGIPADRPPVAGRWLVDPGRWAALRQALATEVARWSAAHPLEPGMPVEVLRHALGLPDRALVDALLAPPPGQQAGERTGERAGERAGGQAGERARERARELTARDGRVGVPPDLPGEVRAGVAQLRADLAGRPFAAPEAGRLAELGLGPRQLGAAVRAGELLKVADGIVLLPDAARAAAAVLAGLPQPFTVSAARQALGTTRRVAVPLLELLDRQGLTRRLPDDRRTTS